MKAIFLGTGKKPFVIEFEDELQNYQALVGGRIEVLHLHTEGTRTIDLIFNEEYRFLFHEVNKYILYKGGASDIITGNIVVVAANEETGEFESLTEDEVKLYLEELKNDRLTITY